MKYISLTRGKIAIVDNADYESLAQHKWSALKNGRTYYAVRANGILTPGYHQIKMHRAILNASDGVEIDHINGDGLDNRRSNLRLCAHAENLKGQKLRRDNKTGFKGVWFNKRARGNPYTAYIKIDYKQIHLGCYKTAKIAARIYDLAALKHHGDFALTNEMLGLL